MCFWSSDLCRLETTSFIDLTAACIAPQKALSVLCVRYIASWFVDCSGRFCRTGCYRFTQWDGWLTLLKPCTAHRDSFHSSIFWKMFITEACSTVLYLFSHVSYANLYSCNLRQATEQWHHVRHCRSTRGGIRGYVASESHSVETKCLVCGMCIVSFDFCGVFPTGLTCLQQQTVHSRVMLVQIEANFVLVSTGVQDRRSIQHISTTSLCTSHTGLQQLCMNWCVIAVTDHWNRETRNCMQCRWHSESTFLVMQNKQLNYILVYHLWFVCVCGSCGLTVCSPISGFGEYTMAASTSVQYDVASVSDR